MIELKLIFKTVDEAIVALAKMAGPAVKGAQPAPAAEQGSAPLAQATMKTRKPRADAGQPRGPNARTQGTAGAVLGTTAVETGQATAEKQADVTDTAPALRIESAAPAIAAPATLEDAEKALTKVFEAKGLAVAQDTLFRFGVKRLKELLPEHRADFIAKAEAVLRGEKI